MNLLMLLELFGGLGMFIYGMHLMSEGLKVVAGKRMRELLDKLTSTPFKALLFGIIITILTQSSSATTVMVVGFVNASLMNLYQSAGIILGSNIGTTLLSQIVAFNITEYSTFFIGLGVLMNLFMKRQKSRDWGGIILGFGILFYGIFLMSDSVTPLKDSPEFIDLLLTYGKNPVIGLLISTIMTSILQSSGAVIGLIQSLALAGVFSATTGTEAIEICIPLIIGSNIGTCITAILSSIGTSNTAKEAALLHLIDKIIGAIWVMILIYVINLFTSDNFIYEFIVAISGTIKLNGEVVPNIARQIAMAHLFFNIANTVVLFPFIKPIVHLVQRILPPERGEEEGLRLDERLLNTPDIAIAQAEQELVKLGRMVTKNFGRAMDMLISLDEEKLNKINETEDQIDEFEVGIQEFAARIVGLGTIADVNQVTFLLENSHILERIGDHACNLMGLALEMINKDEEFSEGMISALVEMKEKIGQMLDQVTELLGDPQKTIDTKFIYQEEGFIDRATCF